jgi:hypothetical protein
MNKVEIKQSGNHKSNVKITLPIAKLMSSIRAADIHPEKGKQNPPHFHVKIK